MNLFDFFDLVREKHEPEYMTPGDEDYEEANIGDGILSEDTYDILGADDWEEHGGDPRGDNYD